MWYQLSLNNISELQSGLLTELLEACGAVSITYQENKEMPIYEPPVGSTPLWQSFNLVALFNDEKKRAFAVEQLTDSHPSLNYQLEDLADKQWERAWMDNFHAMQFGERLWIIPSHEKPPHPDAINIQLDPGLAFGTGTHPTTALCLTWLDKQDLTHKTIIDYGCGSGILAIAAVKLGAKKVYAVDIDPQALEATQENAKRNQINDEQIICSTPDKFEAIQADLLMANILTQALIDLASEFAKRIKPHGQILLSGILAEQGSQIEKAYQHLFKLEPAMQLEEWLCYAGNLRDS